MVITEITLCWWRMHVWPDVYILFIFPRYGWQVPLHLGLYVTLLQFHFLFKILWYSCSFWSNSPRALYFLSMYITKKRNCPYSLCPIFSSLAGSPGTVASSCHWGTHTLPVLPKYTGILYIYTLELQSLWILIPNILCFFGMYCLKITLLLNCITQKVHQLLHAQLDCNI